MAHGRWHLELAVRTPTRIRLQPKAAELVTKRVVMLAKKAHGLILRGTMFLTKRRMELLLMRRGEYWKAILICLLLVGRREWLFLVLTSQQ